MILAAAAQAVQTAAAQSSATPLPEAPQMTIGRLLYTIIFSIVTIYLVARIWKGKGKE